MNDTVLENCKIIKNEELVLANIGILKGSINEISSKKINGKKIIDCNEKFLMPGIIDCHVHFRTPGEQEKEDWSTASKACIASGITTVLDMPNNNPSTTTIKALNQKRKIVEKIALMNFGFHFGATEQNQFELENATNIGSIKIFLGKSTGNLFVEKKEIVEKIFKIAKKRNLVVCVHAEDQKTIEKNQIKFKHITDPMIHSKIRNSKAESIAISKVLQIQKKIGNKLHICHVSSKEGVQLIREAKENQLNVSCEVTPHHLFFTERDLAKLHNFAKVNPSIKSKKDQNALWAGIMDETIDCIASDHAPHLIEEKKQSYWDAPSDMPGIETMPLLLLDVAIRKKIALSKTIELLCQNPAKIFGIKNKGFLKTGFDADLALFDLEKTKKIQNKYLFTKCKWSAFNSKKLYGVLEKTLILGEVVFERPIISNVIVSEEVF